MTSETSRNHIGRECSTIKIAVGYSWAKSEGKVLSPKQDPRWNFLKEKAKSACSAIGTYAETRPGPNKLAVEIRRLRARHGDMILNSVRQRIRDADVLIMDIGNSQNDGFNPNVLIEVGMALGFSHHLDQALFILKPQGQILPSDLHGFLVTDYSFEGSEFRLVDSQGFHAALRSTVQRIAEERLMIGRPKEDIVSVEGDDVTDPTP